jgi:hypothetical protein
MKLLIDALKIIKKYNKMSFRDFIKKYERHYKVKISEKEIKEWEYIGLNNIDFLTLDK